jgi:hypothetical protein
MGWKFVLAAAGWREKKVHPYLIFYWVHWVQDSKK